MELRTNADGTQTLIGDDGNEMGTIQPLQNTTGGDPGKSFENFLKEHNNNAVTAAFKLFDENFRVRSRNRELSSELTKLKAGQGEGTVVLSKEEAEAYNKFKALGTADEVAAAVAEREELKGKLAKTERAAQIADIAKAYGWNADALKQLVEDKGLNVGLKEVEVDGVKTNAGIVKVKEGESEVEKPVEDVLKFYLPLLKAEGASQEAAVEEPQQIIPLPRMGTGAKGPKKSLASQVLSKYAPNKAS